jgi:hypothetical protein
MRHKNINANRNANRYRFNKIIDMQSETPRCNRKNGFIISYINGVWTIINLEPNHRNIRQWRAKVNGEYLEGKRGLGDICKELVHLNPPMRNFI